MKYKVGDRVQIKNLDWYNENKDKDGNIFFPLSTMTKAKSEWCGKVMTILSAHVDFYRMEEMELTAINYWTDEMIEGLVEKTKVGTALNPIEFKPNANCLTMERVDELATKIDKEVPSGNQTVWELPDGYQFKDENGNVINATKIVLEKEKSYPKTYEECINELDIHNTVATCAWEKEMKALQTLLVCCDAYWKIAGEEMGLGKPWEPDWTIESSKYIILFKETKIEKHVTCKYSRILAFPTEEMRDTFYENFKELIEICKELL